MEFRDVAGVRSDPMFGAADVVDATEPGPEAGQADRRSGCDAGVADRLAIAADEAERHVVEQRLRHLVGLGLRGDRNLDDRRGRLAESAVRQCRADLLAAHQRRHGAGRSDGAGSLLGGRIPAVVAVFQPRTLTSPASSAVDKRGWNHFRSFWYSSASVSPRLLRASRKISVPPSISTSYLMRRARISRKSMSLRLFCSR